MSTNPADGSVQIKTNTGWEDRPLKDVRKGDTFRTWRGGTPGEPAVATSNAFQTPGSGGTCWSVNMVQIR